MFHWDSQSEPEAYLTVPWDLALVRWSQLQQSLPEPGMGLPLPHLQGRREGALPATLLSYLLIESEGGRVIAFSCVPTGDTIGPCLN